MLTSSLSPADRSRSLCEPLGGWRCPEPSLSPSLAPRPGAPTGLVFQQPGQRLQLRHSQGGRWLVLPAAICLRGDPQL